MTVVKMMSSDLDSVLQDISGSLYEKMDELLPSKEESSASKLVDAMRYSALAPGKRLRPFLTVTCANIFGVSRSSALQTAAAVEFIHTYSLIHDDLPSMDDDDMRRGQPSCHKKFGEATAILAGDALLTYAFEVLADRSTHGSHSVRCELIRCVGKASGCRGMVAGQALDMEAEEKDLDINQIIHLQRLKTGELFATSCEVGAILGNSAPNLRNQLRAYAHDIGLAFQITDDLLDAQAGDNDNERTDKAAGKATFVSALGMDKAKEQARILSQQAITHIKTFGNKANLLKDLAHYVVDRSE